jgi:lipopolysaccharide transport system ATP-binding protein
MSLLTVHNLGKAYRKYKSEWQRFSGWFGIPIKPSEENWVLKHVSFEIHPGESIGIIGQNGAGKSTLLKMIAGTLQPTEGQVKVNGRIAAILELGMGFSPELTGRQNAFHAAGLMGFSAEQIQQVMPEIEAFAEIGEYFDGSVRTYSSGMQARVAFAVATAFRPDILIVDEALSVGDALFQAKCYERINSFKKQGTTLILVTHSIGDIVNHCNRALYIRNGQLKVDGSSRDVSNIYMDDLFSKHKEKSADLSVAETINDASDVMSGIEDNFNTRPGYRKEEHRWGDGGGRILDFLVRADNQDYPAVIMSNSKAEFYFKVIFDKEFDGVTAGILLKTHEGVFLYGTNSFLAGEGKQVISVEKGAIIVFKFEVPMSLNAGHYLMSFGISTGPQELLIPLERRYDSVFITIERSMGFWGLVDLQSKFGFTEEKINVA